MVNFPRLLEIGGGGPLQIAKVCKMQRAIGLDKAREIAASNKQGRDGKEITAGNVDLQHVRASGVAGDYVRRKEASLHGRLRARAARDCAGMALYGGRLGRDCVPPRAFVRLSSSA